MRGGGAAPRSTRDGCGEAVCRIAGLVPDPYFSASKLRRLLDSASPERRGALAFGTVDSFLLRRLIGGRVHATDATNASRTALFDICRLARSDESLDLFGVPRAVLPEVRDTAGRFGTTERDLPGRAVPVTAMAGDRRAALDSVCFRTCDPIAAMRTGAPHSSSFG